MYSMERYDGKHWRVVSESEVIIEKLSKVNAARLVNYLHGGSGEMPININVILLDPSAEPPHE